MRDTDEKVAVVTGASRGLGLALANRLWRAGYSLVMVSSSPANLEAAAAGFEARGRQKVIQRQCDLAVHEEIAAFVEYIQGAFGHVDLLVNNAAIQGPIGPLEDNDPIYWQKTFAVNLFAPAMLMRGLLRWMGGERPGTVINVSGGGATGPRPNFTAYASAKAALVRLTETLAMELKDSNINVNCIAPGAMKTAMLQEVFDKGKLSAGEKEHAIAADILNNGGASMERVADLVLFLCSAAARGITGKLISANWDRWEDWPDHFDELAGSDLYTLRRIVGRDRGCDWGDK